MDAKTPPSSTEQRQGSDRSASTNESSPPTGAFHEAINQFNELGEFASYFLATKIDGIKASVRKAGLYAALGVIGLLAAGALVITSVVLVCLGLSELIAGAFSPPKPWVGNLVVGIVLLGLVGAAGWFGVSRVMNASRDRTVRKYEDRKRRQRASFGEDVHSRANGGEP